MAQVLTGPFVIAALVLVVAGAAKLRAPAGAVLAVRSLGLPQPRILVALAAVGELCLGLWALGAPGRAGALALAGAYAGLAGVALVLARREASCGCFGHARTPASKAQALLSLVLMAVSAGAALWPVRGFAEVVRAGAGPGVVLGVGCVGAAYAVVLAYTELPQAWSAWRAQ